MKTAFVKASNLFFAKENKKVLFFFEHFTAFYNLCANDSADSKLSNKALKTWQIK